MVKETTIIFMDTSDYMGYHESPRYLAQLDAMELYIQLILKPHPEHYVGVFGLAGHVASVVVEPTNDISDVMTRVRRSRICVQGEIFVSSALHLVMDLHKDVLKRMVVFIGGPLWDPYYNILGTYPTHLATVRGRGYTDIGTRLKEMGVAVDVINFGTQQKGFKKHTLCLILAAANNNDNTRMLDRSGHHHLDASSFVALVGEGRTGLKSVLLMQGDDFQTAITQFDKVHIHDLKRKRDRKRKRDDKGHDEGWETYPDRGDRYGRKRDYRGHDEGRESYVAQGDRYDRKQDDRGNDDTRDRKRKRDDKGHDEVRETYRGRGYGFGRRQDDTLMMVGKDIGIEVIGLAENRIIEVMMRDGKYIGIKVIGMAKKRDYRGHDAGKDTGLEMVEYERGRDEKSSCASSRS